MARQLVTVDFETEAIQDRPVYPPKPVGVAIRYPGRKSKYLAWGHHAENNTTKEKAAEELRDIWRDHELLFHNGQFDLDVAEVHMGCPLPAWDRFHDTLFSVFLSDPHAKTLSLKPTAERLLGVAPDERDAVRDWLVAQRIIPSNLKRWGGNISKAPGKLVGTYAIGDVDRTYGLHRLLYPKFDKEMKGAYDRERRLLPILLANEREGMRVDLELLEQDIAAYQKDLEKADKWLRKTLNAPGLNLDADEDVAGVLKREKIVTEFVKTKTGRDSISKKNLTPDLFHNKKVAAAYGYRQRLATTLSTWMIPWLEVASANKGYIFTRWNQVRGEGEREGSFTGTRTGRLSCSRWQNIPKDWYDKDDGYVYPKWLGVRDLPLVRKYLLPDRGEEFLHRDYSQQELRILAHFAEGTLLKAYKENPRLDVHKWVQALIKEVVGLDIPRRPVKILNFGKVYGMGVPGVMAKLKCDEAHARTLVAAHARALPDVQRLGNDIQREAKNGGHIRTWGGRIYYAEPSKFSEKYQRQMSYEYKLLNYLIQGSAADCTKEALIRYHDHPKRKARFLVTVHDEINSSSPKKTAHQQMMVLKEVMEGIEFDVPMLSDGERGSSWGNLTTKDD